MTPLEMKDKVEGSRAFAQVHGFNALTGSDAFWLLEYVDYLRGVLTEIEAGYGKRLSAAELASMARQAL